MKKITLTVVAIFAMTISYAQKTRGAQRAEANELYKNRAVVERFSTSVIRTDEERILEQQANEDKRFQILSYLDTLSISKGSKAKLLKDLDENPFSARFKKFMERYRREVLVVSKTKSLAQQ